ncbi:MAG: hypothetical protein LBI48_13205 [Burkholderiaceae bacterium]|jgi:hypothetical protein|nr:hypothetical protein [Burkholderiaceae bacterium]
MKYKFKTDLIVILACAAVLAGCASTPAAPPGTLRVTYSLQLIDGTRLKEAPTEIRLVQRETTGRAVAAQAVLNILLVALTRSVAVSGFSKTDLKGERIEDVDDRVNLQNPVSTVFVQSLQGTVDARMTKENIGQDRSFRYPLVVGGGYATLVYDTLVEQKEPSYQLALKLDVYKRPENSWIKPAYLVQCSDRSEPPQPLAHWAESSYANARQELDRMLSVCQSKVLTELPRLLEE